VGELVGQLTNDVTTLMRQELALAKAEMREEAKKAGKAAGMLAGAGLAGYFVLLFLSLTLMWLLGYIFDSWAWAALIVTIIWGIIGAVLFTMGRKQLKEVNPKPEQTVESLKEDKEWVKAQKS
jgi:nitrate/nitrite transporter NarK